MRAALAGSLLAVLAGLGLSGCAGNSLPRSDTTASSVEPRCSRGDEGAAANGVILMAQSVPTASWVPCLRRALPPGWDFGGLKARDGIAQFSLTSGNDQEQVIQVRLQPSCDTRGSTEIHSDRDGMRRFERVTQTTPGFVGRRYYLFEGGCITFGFTLGPDNRGEPLALAGQVVGAVTRADLSEQVHDESDGRLSLDPVGNGRAMTTTEDPAPPERQQRPLWRRVLGPAFSVALLVAVFVWFLPKFTSITDVWTSVLSMSWLQVALLLVAAVWNLATYQFVVLSTMPGLTFPQATVSTETTTAVANTVVGGSAISLGLTYAMNTSWGFSRSRTSVSLLVSGLFNNFAKLGLPVFAVAWLAFSGTPTAGRLLTGAAGVAGLVAAVVALWLLLRSRESAAWLGRGLGLVASAVLRPFGRPPVQGWDRALAKFRDRTVLLLHARWYWIALATLVSHLSLFLVLLLALRFVGVDAAAVTAAEALAVFAFARLLTAIPFTPGGLGVVEFALITGLAAAGGPRAMVAAAVLIFRALTYVLPIPLGLVTYVIWQRKKSWRRAPNSAPRTELVPETV